MYDLIWRTDDGRLIPVSRMSSRHIGHCLRKIDRLQWRLEYRGRLVLELEMRALGLAEDPGDWY